MTKIVCANAWDYLRALPPESVDLIFTSPPYAEQRKNSYGGIPEDEYPDWMQSIVIQGMKALKPTGSFVLNIKEHVNNNGVRSLYVMNTILLLAHGFNFVEEFIWNKTNPFPTGNKKRVKDGFERIFQFTKSKEYKFFPNELKKESTSVWAGTNEKRKNKGYFTTKNGSRMAMGKRVTGNLVRPSNVLTLPSSCVNIGHPAVFPVELPEFFIRLMTETGDMVVDPFMGSGTTLIAAKKLDRNYGGCDIMQEYVDLTEKRLNEN